MTPTARPEPNFFALKIMLDNFTADLNMLLRLAAGNESLSEDRFMAYCNVLRHAGALSREIEPYAAGTDAQLASLPR